MIRERCGSVRHIGNIGAVIILANGQRISCIVCDFSKSGALLLLTSILGLPKDFCLHAHGSPCRKVVSVWRGSGKIGVRFG